MLSTQSWFKKLHSLRRSMIKFPSVYRFSHAADAFENCDPKFKAVFAEPKSSNRNTQSNFPDRTDSRARSSRYDDFSNYDHFDMRGRNSRTTLNITCSHLVIL